MRGDCPFDYQNHQGVLVDPTQFEVHEALEEMHHQHTHGKRAYAITFSNWAGKDEELGVNYGYNVRC
jgi:hypothetical protein